MQTQLSSFLKAELQPNVTLCKKKKKKKNKIDKPDGENVFLTTKTYLFKLQFSLWELIKRWILFYQRDTSWLFLIYDNW